MQSIIEVPLLLFRDIDTFPVQLEGLYMVGVEGIHVNSLV